MASAGPLIALAVVALVLGAAGGVKRRRKKVSPTPEGATPEGAIPASSGPDRDPGREPEGGSEPPPGGTAEVEGGADNIVNLLNASPPEKRIGSRVPWAIVIHQMGFSRGNDPYKYRKVTAHYIITPDGTIAQLHPVTAYLYAANGFNEGGISIEFAGNFPSESRSTQPSDFYKPDKMGMDQLTVAQVESGRWLVEYLHDVVLPDINQDLTVMVAHRQSGAQRQNDPGPDVWANVGQWAVNVIGLSDGGPGFTVGGGHPIEDEWREAPLLV